MHVHDRVRVHLILAVALWSSGRGKLVLMWFSYGFAIDHGSLVVVFIRNCEGFRDFLRKVGSKLQLPMADSEKRQNWRRKVTGEG